jgi:hypothetical protein
VTTAHKHSTRSCRCLCSQSDRMDGRPVRANSVRRSNCHCFVKLTITGVCSFVRMYHYLKTTRRYIISWSFEIRQTATAMTAEGRSGTAGALSRSTPTSVRSVDVRIAFREHCIQDNDHLCNISFKPRIIVNNRTVFATLVNLSAPTRSKPFALYEASAIQLTFGLLRPLPDLGRTCLY